MIVSSLGYVNWVFTLCTCSVFKCVFVEGFPQQIWFLITKVLGFRLRKYFFLNLFPQQFVWSYSVKRLCTATEKISRLMFIPVAQLYADSESLILQQGVWLEPVPSVFFSQGLNHRLLLDHRDFNMRKHVFLWSLLYAIGQFYVFFNDTGSLTGLHKFN